MRKREADAKFVKALLEATGSKEKALDEVAKRGWRALATGKLGEAAQRFNQAFLVAPEQSVVYHGLAAVAQIRFNDLAFAEELYRIARKQPNPLKMLNADYGRVLLVASGRRRRSRCWSRPSRMRRISATPGSTSPGPASRTATAPRPAPPPMRR